MNKSEQIGTLLSALIKARGEIKPAAKSGKNTFDKYDYAKEEDWHDAVMPALLANGLTISFSIEETVNLPDRTTSNGKTEHAVEVHGDVTLLHESGEWLQVGVAGQGQDRADKAIYKAMTGAKKYGYACLFALPTSDDPEKDSLPSAAKAPLNPAAKARPPKKPAEPTKPAGVESEMLAMLNTFPDAKSANWCLKNMKTKSWTEDAHERLSHALVKRAAEVGSVYNKDSEQFEDVSP